VLLDANDDVEEPEYLISPFILKNSFNLFYGSGGSGKTTFALLLCLMLKNPEIAKSINYNVNNPHEILYLDYESSQASIQRTYALLSRLYFPERTRLFYRKCSIPFIQDIEKIKEYIQDKKIDLIVIDSIGIACSAELNKDETANSFAMALRSLETTALCIGHTSKERTDKKTPFGTVFFLNNARNVFEIRRLYKPGEKELTIGLFHRKANFSELKRPCVFKFRYSEHAIEVEKHDSVREEDFMSEMPISEQIKHMLTKESMTIKQLSDLLNTSENVIKVILYRMKAKGVVVKIEQDKWALLYH
jgi:energy-coupling factor transporter ATP-binding protein EcfA2